MKQRKDDIIASYRDLALNKLRKVSQFFFNKQKRNFKKISCVSKIYYISSRKEVENSSSEPCKLCGNLETPCDGSFRRT